MCSFRPPLLHTYGVNLPLTFSQCHAPGVTVINTRLQYHRRCPPPTEPRVQAHPLTPDNMMWLKVNASLQVIQFTHIIKHTLKKNNGAQKNNTASNTTITGGNTYTSNEKRFPGVVSLALICSQLAGSRSCVTTC